MSLRDDVPFLSWELALEQDEWKDHLDTVEDPDDLPDVDVLDREDTRALALARAQLDEWVRALRSAAGVGAGELASPTLLVRILRDRAATLPADDQREHLLDAFDEGVRLREALQDRVGVRQCHNSMGEHTLTLGPALPSLGTLGIIGSPVGELCDDPAGILAIARTLTLDACALSVALQRHRPAGDATGREAGGGQAPTPEPVGTAPLEGASAPRARAGAHDSADAAHEAVADVAPDASPTRWLPFARRLAAGTIWVRNGKSSHPDFPGAIACAGPILLRPGDPGWDTWDRELGDLDVIEPGEPPF